MMDSDFRLDPYTDYVNGNGEIYKFLSIPEGYDDVFQFTSSNDNVWSFHLDGTSYTSFIPNLVAKYVKPVSNFHDPNVFIPWIGKKCPEDYDTNVDVRYTDNEIVYCIAAGYVDWNKDTAINRIVAYYRISEYQYGGR